MNHKTLYGISAVIFSLGYTFSMLQSAWAIPGGSGPSISMGSNPISHANKNCNGLNNSPMIANNSNMDFIITDIITYNGTVALDIDGTMAMVIQANDSISLRSGLVVEPGQVLNCSDYGSYPYVTLTGYYAHP